tara:strand:- start:1630 stop:1842 length:213 start_codon:yes stop_codon:yes gene_type:complete
MSRDRMRIGKVNLDEAAEVVLGLLDELPKTNVRGTTTHGATHNICNRVADELGVDADKLLQVVEEKSLGS